MIYALIGNPNCGKTALFNQLTKTHQHVGNFPGVTVEKKMGTIQNYDDEVIVDLPGLYSLLPYSDEEIVTRNFLLNEEIGAIINIVDVTNIERSLYLSLQLMELEIPMVIALNMMDELKDNGGMVFIKELSRRLGVPVIPISALQNEGLDHLIYQALKVAKGKILPKKNFIYTGIIKEALDFITLEIQPYLKRATGFVAMKLLEGDELFLQNLNLSQKNQYKIKSLQLEIEKELNMDGYEAMASMRYRYIETVVHDTIKKGRNRAHARTLQIDALLMHPKLAFVLFIILMLLVFYLSFSVVGPLLTQYFSIVIDAVVFTISHLLKSVGVSSLIYSMVVDGALLGISSVLSFLPMIVTLFFFLSLLEDSGYMARVVFMMDHPLQHLGLSGRSFVSLFIGLGCSVPAVMATRTLSSEKERKRTILLIPFMSCSAKFPVYSVLCYTFYKKNSPIVLLILYVLGISIGILVALILEGFTKIESSQSFFMELPHYRLPSFRSVAYLVWGKAKDFLMKAFTIIFVASMVIWFLKNFDIHLQVVSDIKESLLALIGQWLVPFFKPLGFFDWRMIAALMAGIFAKETILSTLALTCNNNLAQLFTPLSAFSFLVFCLFYTPCVATLSVIKKELHSYFSAIILMIFQTAIAYFIALIVYQLGCIIM